MPEQDEAVTSEVEAKEEELEMEDTRDTLAVCTHGDKLGVAVVSARSRPQRISFVRLLVAGERMPRMFFSSRQRNRLRIGLSRRQPMGTGWEEPL